MNFYVVIALAFGPGAFWLWYFYKKDNLEPEPKTLVLRMFILGMIGVIPAFLAELIFQYPIQLITSSTFFSSYMLLVVGAPIIEEYIKFWLVKRGVYNNVEFNEPMDGIVYTAAAALGFASLENLGYVGGAYMTTLDAPSGSSEIVWSVFIIRAIFSVPAHVLFSAMWGYALGASKFMRDRERARLFVRRGLILSMLLHGTFNTVINFPLAMAFMLAFMFLAWRMVRYRITVALVNSPFAGANYCEQDFVE
ncbi:MAG: PrsW family intramembrane metalloprotease [Candidatus Hinthialibacter sp.]